MNTATNKYSTRDKEKGMLSSVVLCISSALKVQLLNKMFLYLWVGELHTRNRKHHFACSYQEVLRDLEGHVNWVGLDVLYRNNRVLTLPENKTESLFLHHNPKLITFNSSISSCHLTTYLQPDQRSLKFHMSIRWHPILQSWTYRIHVMWITWQTYRRSKG